MASWLLYIRTLPLYSGGQEGHVDMPVPQKKNVYTRQLNSMIFLKYDVVLGISLKLNFTMNYERHILK